MFFIMKIKKQSVASSQRFKMSLLRPHHGALHFPHYGFVFTDPRNEIVRMFPKAFTSRSVLQTSKLLSAL